MRLNRNLINSILEEDGFFEQVEPTPWLKHLKVVGDGIILSRYNNNDDLDKRYANWRGLLAVAKARTTVLKKNGCYYLVATRSNDDHVVVWKEGFAFFAKLGEVKSKENFEDEVFEKGLWSHQLHDFLVA